VVPVTVVHAPVVFAAGTVAAVPAVPVSV